MIKQNLEEIRHNIQSAAEKSNRSAKDITLVCVTKTVDVERIAEAIHCGVTELGENRVQEMLEKLEPLEHLNPNWHLIGHLQTNKVKYIIDKVKLIHSVDSLDLAKEIDKRAKMKNIVSNILIEINIAQEETKFGVKSEHLNELVKNISQLPNIRTCGLMTVPPYVECGEKNRYYFKLMREIFLDMSVKNVDNMCMSFLSMGMTGDYQVAIEEGANIIRVGTGVFGSRF